MRKAGITQASLAKKHGCTPGAVTLYLDGNSFSKGFWICFFMKYQKPEKLLRPLLSEKYGSNGN